MAEPSSSARGSEGQPAYEGFPATADNPNDGRYVTGWPPVEDDLPVVTDPNYCIDMERAA